MRFRVFLVLCFTALLPIQSALAVDRYITVTASGTVKVKPDTVRINASVWATSATSAEALSQAKAAAVKVRTVLSENQITAPYIKSSSLTVFPEYNYTQDKGSVLQGYKANQSFEIIVRVAANAGAVVDALVGAAGNNLSIEGVTPYLYDQSGKQESARSAAVIAAKAKANSYAKLLTAKLGKIIYLEEAGATSPYPIMMAQAKSDAGSTLVDLGTQDVTVSVTTRWSIL